MYRFFKRFFDLLSALLLLIIISPILLILIVLVKIKLGGPVFYTQERTTKNQRTFKMFKFRSMTNETDENGNLLPDEKRITKFGAFLRSTSLDELPEIFSIIKGDMSVVGPRPLPTYYNPYYRKNEMDRFNVRSGLITPGSYDENPSISWDMQLEYESNYGKKCTFIKDIKLFFHVFVMLFKRYKTNYGEFFREDLNIERNEQEVEGIKENEQNYHND